ncbi:MAG: TldD/PmbA family protein [Treponema sp.]|nr:TldD/PmbA family protein [Treponema sp.]
MKYKFPENLYTEVRIEDTYSAHYYLRDDDPEGNGEVQVTGARIRVFDGKMWYTSTTNDLDAIQTEIDKLAKVAKPNPNILKNKIVKNFTPNQAENLKFQNEKSLRNVTKEQREAICRNYKKTCTNKDVPEIKVTHTSFWCNSMIKTIYTSKGTEIKQDYQRCGISFGHELSVNGATFWAGKQIHEFFYDDLLNREDEIKEELQRGIEFARTSVPVEPGEYTCVLAPTVTSVFTHESFGHKSEADFMLNDKTLQDEWVMGKKVGNEKVTIIDEGDELRHGYCPYDDEGNKKQKVFLMKNGVLSGRLHDAKSAATLKEKPTGNARAQSFYHNPIVRMTNTYMDAGKDDPEQIVKEVKDGIYVYDWNYGTGNSTFTIQPQKAYRIRDGKIAEPVRINVITGSVFQTLFDIDAVGTDLKFFSGTCGKNGQSMPTATGGPTIRVKKLTIN